jgi:two-component system, OmpR family, sensor histidine kinase TctE
VLALSVISGYELAIRPAMLAYDQALADAAVAIAAHLDVVDGRPRIALTPQSVAIIRVDRFDEIFFSVSGPRGESLAGDEGLPTPPPGEDTIAYFDTAFRGKPLRVAAYRRLTDAGNVTIAVGETMVKRHRAARNALLALLVPNLTLILASLVLVYGGVRMGLAPLSRVRDEIEHRSAEDLRPLDLAPAPGEIRPLVQALNRLLERMRESAEAQQRFLANAAHQLRTPLAGLQAQLEVLALDPAAAAVAARLERLREATRRASHLAHQLLALARAESLPVTMQSRQALDLADIAADTGAASVAGAEAKGLELDFELDAAPVDGVGWLLKEMVVNLIDNGIRYTPGPGRVTVRTGVAPDDGPVARAAYVAIEDTGPGIAEAERNNVLERFYRIKGSEGTGSGLGLAIVGEIANLHGAALAIGSGAGGRGTVVTVRFPLRGAPQRR